MNGSGNLMPVKTSAICYFCNGSFESTQLLQRHIKQCGSILEECPDRCGAWLERRLLQAHALQCPIWNASHPGSKTPSLPTSRASTLQREPIRPDQSDQFHKLDQLHQLIKQLELLRLSQAEEKLQREKLQNEVTKLKRQYNLSEERNRILLAKLSSHQTLEEQSAKKSMLIDLVKQDLEHVQETTQKYSSYASQSEMRFDSLQKVIEREQIERSHLELIVNGQDGKIRTLQALETSIELLKEDIALDKKKRDDQMMRLERESANTEQLIMQDFTVCKERIKKIERSNADVLEKLSRNFDDASKYQLVHFESKSLKAAVEEDSVKVESLNKTVSNLSKLVTILQQQRHPAINHDIHHIVSDCTGHLLWRIDNYEDKLTDSVDNDCVLLSPLFKTSQYGYTIQAELYLNGLGKWKGRHLTASVFIVPGECDPLLEWPPALQANIILKDQATKRNQSVKPIDIVKTLMVKKKENFDDRLARFNSLDSKSNRDRNGSVSEAEKINLDATIRRQYIFFPHTSLDKFEYIKNNTMFVEIIVSNC